MTEFAKELVADSASYPMHSEAVRFLDGKIIAGRVEWHSWSTKGQHGMGGDPNEKIPGTFRGGTLYEVVDPNAYGEYLYQKQQIAVSGEPMHRYHFGATAPVRAVKPRTVTQHAQAVVSLAAKPVRWTFHTAGSLVKWTGNTLQSIADKL